jgi:MFS transporter, DHA1 family, multidrug resistance protein
MDKESDTAIQMPPSKPQVDYVDFDGPDDPLHPWNWSIGKRYTFVSCYLVIYTNKHT